MVLVDDDDDDVCVCEYRVYDEPLIELVDHFFIPILKKLYSIHPYNGNVNNKGSINDGPKKVVKGVKRFLPPTLEWNSKNNALEKNHFQSILEYMYIHQVPVVIWCTLKMRESFHNSHETWMDYLNEEHCIEWKSPEHCVTLIGFENYNNSSENKSVEKNEKNDSSSLPSVVIVNDPDYGCEMRYDRKLFEKRFEEMGGMAFSFEFDECPLDQKKESLL